MEKQQNFNWRAVNTKHTAAIQTRTQAGEIDMSKTTCCCSQCDAIKELCSSSNELTVTFNEICSMVNIRTFCSMHTRMHRRSANIDDVFNKTYTGNIRTRYLQNWIFFVVVRVEMNLYIHILYLYVRLCCSYNFCSIR